MKKLTESDLEFIKSNKLLGEDSDKFVPVKRMTKKMIKELIKKYKYHSMTESDYSYGNGEYCWQEIYEEGVWFRTEKDVINCINSTCKYSLPLAKEYGRIYIYRCEDYMRMMIYTKDIDEYIVWITMWND